ncbi:MAG TPA: histidine phosphatase family protein [Rhodospirillaceae bacterium]|nr:histidine phosphatase family protein [Rhodospirillaceae bacterium]
MFFMRHGQSVFNVVHDRTGRDPQTPDAELSALGMTQARKAAMQLEGRRITAIISSPFTRALQTASFVAEVLRLPIEIDPLVSERGVHSCDIGSPASVLRARFPALAFSALGGGQWWPPQNESARTLQERVHAFMTKMSFEDRAATTLVVSHWYFINAATGACPDNAEVVEVRV